MEKEVWKSETLTERTGCGEMKIIINLTNEGTIDFVHAHFGKNGTCVKTILEPFLDNLRDTFTLEKNAQLEKIDSMIGGVCIQGEGNTCVDIMLKAIYKYIDQNVKERKENSDGN